MTLASDTATTLSVEVYRRVGELVTVFQSLAADEQMPLTELQSALLATVAIQSMDGLASSLAFHLSADAGLRTGRLDWLLNKETP